MNVPDDPIKSHVVVRPSPLNACTGKSLLTLNTTIQQPVNSLKRNPSVVALLGLVFVVCVCFCGHLAITEIVLLRT